MRRNWSFIGSVGFAVGLVSAATPALAGPPPAQGEVIAKFTSATSLFQIDLNQNFIWDGGAGGDATAIVAPGAGVGSPVVGDAGAPCKQVGASSVFCDKNRNGTWNGNAGGDLSAVFAAGAGAGTIFFADLNGDGTEEMVKFYNGVGATNFFQVDTNQNTIWNGSAGGDSVVNIAPSVAGGVPFACDCDGNGTIELGKYVAATSAVYVDLNNNGIWNGNAGGDKSATIAVGAGPATTFLFGNLAGSAAEELIKHYASLGGSEAFQVDLNNNFAWNGGAGGDGVASLSPGAGAGVPCTIDLDGDGTTVICKWIGASSSVFADLNGNRAWNGNAGGDKAATFAAGGGAGVFVVLKKP